MPTSDYGQVYFPDDNSPADQGVNMGKMAESLEGTTVRRFSSVAARDAAFSTLTNEQKSGTFAFIDGLGWSGWNGSGWQQFPMKGMTWDGGHKSVTTNGVGLFSIPHGLGVSACIADVRILYAGNLGQLTNTIIQIREFQLNNVVCMALNRDDGQGKQSESMIVQWRVEKF